MPSFADGRVTLHAGDCLRVLAKLPENSVDSIVCDPPYHLTAKRGASAGFMGKAWDGGDIAFRPDVWIAALRVLKPGGHLVAFSAARTYHRLAVAIEDAGFEIRDQLLWLYGSGFPKSLDVSKAIDKAAGAKREIGDYRSPAHAIPRKPARERQHEGWSRPYMDDAALYDASLRCSLPATDAAREWSGWGTALKPAHEPLVCARKPLGERTVAANVLRWGCGALNIDACRVETSEGTSRACAGGFGAAFSDDNWTAPAETTNGGSPAGRWPANLVHDGSPEVLAAFPDSDGAHAPVSGLEPSSKTRNGFRLNGARPVRPVSSDSGSAARFFYCAKATRAERRGSKHPTVKPVKLMRWLARLVTPPGGVILDPFAGTGTTAEAALAEGFRAILIEREAEYRLDIARRLTSSAVGSRQSAVGSRAAPTAASRATGANHRPHRSETLTPAA